MANIVSMGAGSGFGGRLSIEILSREAALHACVCDPLTAAVLPLPNIRAMFDGMHQAAADAGLLRWFDGGRAGRLPETCAQ